MILVTGGTGFVGQEVVAELLRLGEPVRLLVRNPEKAGKLPFAKQVELVKGDVLQPDTLPAAMTGVTAVIHLVGFIIETRHISYEQGHFEATRNLLAAAEAAGVTRWIQMSATGTRPNARSRYHQTKWQAEEAVRQSGLDWTIFRPSVIYGYDKRDRLMNIFRRLLSPPLDVLTLYSFGLVNGGEPLIQPVFVKEVARCFAAAPGKPESVGKTFDLVGPEPMHFYGIVATINSGLGRKTVRQRFPVLVVVRAALWLAYIIVAVVLGCLAFPAGAWIQVSCFVLFLIGVRLAAAFSPFMIRPVTEIFCLPGEFLIKAAEVLNRVAPQGFRPSEVLKMAVEDNTGDPRPAAEVFGYEPEKFEEGVKRMFGKKTPSS